jgi:hypothetical protein
VGIEYKFSKILKPFRSHNLRDTITPNHKNIPIIGDLKTPKLCQYSTKIKGTFFSLGKNHILFKIFPKLDLATPNANTITPLPLW